VTKIGKTSLTLAVDAATTEEVRVRATLTVVLVSLDSRRPVPVTSDLRAKLERFVVPLIDPRVRPA